MPVDNPDVQRLGYPQGCGGWGFVLMCVGNAKDSRPGREICPQALPRYKY